MKARVTVTLKTGILDPQGKAIEGALRSLGLAGVASVRQGKVFDIEIEGSDPAKAEALLKQAAHDFPSIASLRVRDALEAVEAVVVDYQERPVVTFEGHGGQFSSRVAARSAPN